MKRYKRILPSTLVLITLMSSITTEDIFATTRAEYFNSDKEVLDDTNLEVNSDENITTGSAIEITTGPAMKIIKPRNEEEYLFTDYEGNTCKYDNGWTYKYDVATKTAEITEVIPEKKEGDVIIPANVVVDGELYTVTGIGPFSFIYSELLTSVVIPDSVTYIGRNAFMGCTSLTKVTLSKNLTELGWVCFAESGLTEITIPGTVTTIGEGAFLANESLKSATLLEGVPIIAASMFSRCVSLENIVIPNSVTQIDTNGFYDCKSLEEIKLPNTLKTIGAYAFTQSGLKYLQIPTSVNNLNQYAIMMLASLDPSAPYNFIRTAYLNTPDTNEVEIDIYQVAREVVTGNTLYIKYDIIPEIYLNSEKINENVDEEIVFPAWIEEKDLIDYAGIPTRGELDFNGWEVEAKKVVFSDGTVRIMGNVKFTAKWSKPITYNFNDGTSSTSTIIQTADEKYDIPEVPVRDGYNFTGWYSDEECTNVVDTNTIFTETSPVILYAGWELIEPTEEVETPIEETPTEETPTEETPTEETPTEEMPTVEIPTVEIPAVEIPDENNTDNNNYYYDDDTVVSVKTDIKTTIDTSNVVNTKDEEVQPEKTNKIRFNQFTVKVGSNEFVTKYTDGTVKHAYAYNKTYIDKTTNSMYVSLRGVIDNSIDKFEIKWNPKTSSVEVTFLEKGTKIIFTANSSIMTVNGVERQMLTAEGKSINAQLVNGNLMIPLRFVAELFDFNVAYDNDKKDSVVSTKKN